jgi:hypothetical protein
VQEAVIIAIHGTRAFCNYKASGSSTSLLAVGLRDLSDELGPGHIASLSPRGSEA